MLVAPAQSLAIEALPNGRSEQGSQLECIGRARLSSANPSPEGLQDRMGPTLLDPPSAEGVSPTRQVEPPEKACV
ncbi:uncharacterized protein N7511_010045 [Penicillium nucicola]|uniref:uncharacterized protein n=1 Tax=Penicillium nucicola TaxID=1850975 RepID=UPI00254525EB|nr:uncharacterized protein N7511_010045 [Penicillium nucicola]KAJ5748349.1 hypothetical protein N7511_010045 [Penicillium nucicola]